MVSTSVNFRPMAWSITLKLLVILVAAHLVIYILSVSKTTNRSLAVRTQLSHGSVRGDSDVYDYEAPSSSDKLIKTSPITQREENTFPLSCPVPPLLSGTQFRQYIKTEQTKCANKTVWGGPPKGSKGSAKRICFDDRFKIRPGDCLVFSFGINFDFSFEDEFANYGCQVFAYDPTMDVEDYERSPRLQFIATGIANYQGTKYIGMNTNWKQRKVDRFENLVKAAGMEGKVIDMVKLDVELSELDFLQDMLFNSLHVLKNIKQIAMEIHAEIRSNKVSPISRFQVFWPYLHLMRCAGFELISSSSGGKWQEIVWAQEKEW